MEQSAVRDTVDFKAELVRKGIHFFSLAIPVVYSFISKKLALEILIPLTVIFIILDLARYEIPQFSGLFYKFVGFLLRKHEVDEKKHALNGATFMLISAVICIVIFPKYIMVSSFVVLILADSASAVFGKRFGKHKIFPSRGMPKSYEGSLAFIIAGAAAVALTPKVDYLFAEYLVGIAATVVASAAEVLSYDIVDDNIAIPISFGLTMWALYIIFLPRLNVFFMG
ncbi:MAG: dolichol kinase [Bacteroidetes bacterium]|nr:dolichol kinase [Bacteroidota bacterium]MCL5737776.1 dolichol kinase [Bacteroidota bacterium]